MSYIENPEADALAASARKAAKAILELDIHPMHKKQLLSFCLWKLTESEGVHKYALRYQTPAGTKATDKRHDHVQERKKVVASLLANPERADEILADIVGCVVSKEEHLLLNRFGKEHHGWDRYRAAGLTVRDLKEGTTFIEPASTVSGDME